MVIEVMGRHSGWIALHAGLAGGADMILIPEQKYTIQEIVSTIRKRHERGKDFSIVVVAEGAQLVSEEGGEKEYVVSEGGPRRVRPRQARRHRPTRRPRGRGGNEL